MNARKEACWKSLHYDHVWRFGKPDEIDGVFCVFSGISRIFCELDIRKIKSFVLSLYLTYLIKLFMDAGDNELIKCIKEGDLKAFEKVFKDYYALMCSVAMDYVNDSAMCQTLTEDVLLNLWEKKNELVITTSLRAYLLRAVRNKCIDHLRTQRQNSDFLGYYDSLDGMFGGAMADEKDLFEQLISDELAELLDRAIDEMPEERRRVFILVRMENKTYQEAADMLHISVNTVKYHLKRAHAELQDKLSAYILLQILSFMLLSRLLHSLN